MHKLFFYQVCYLISLLAILLFINVSFAQIPEATMNKIRSADYEVVFHPVCLCWVFDELYSRAKIVFFSVHSTAGRGQLSNGGFSAGKSVPSASILGTCLR